MWLDTLSRAPLLHATGGVIDARDGEIRVIDKAAARGHMEFGGMRSRAARAGGTLHIAALPEGGPEVMLAIPLMP